MPKIELDDKRRCEECNGFGQHKIECSHITVEQLREVVSHYKKSEAMHIKHIQTHWSTWDRLRKETERWKGKFLIVKHENNKLRKKINSK